MHLFSRGLNVCHTARAPRLSGSLFLAIAAPLFVAAGLPASAQKADGRTILDRTIAAYQALTSYSGQANVDTLLVNQRGVTVKHIGSSSVMKFQRPNKLYLYFITPVGSRGVWSDATTLSVYDATLNTYRSGPSAPTLSAMLPLLLQRAEVASGMDPLYFLSQNTLPKELENVTLEGYGDFNGHQVAIVTAVTNSHPQIIRLGNGTVTVPTSYWTWWIDRHSYMIQKIETRTPNVTKRLTMQVGSKYSVAEIKGTMILRHTVSDIRPNFSMPASTFQFRPPKGSHEQRSPADILRGGR